MGGIRMLNSIEAYQEAGRKAAQAQNGADRPLLTTDEMQIEIFL